MGGTFAVAHEPPRAKNREVTRFGSGTLIEFTPSEPRHRSNQKETAVIVNLDKKKLAETFENTVDPNLLYEELDSADHDHDDGVNHKHDHDHVQLLEQTAV